MDGKARLAVEPAEPLMQGRVTECLITANVAGLCFCGAPMAPAHVFETGGVLQPPTCAECCRWCHHFDDVPWDSATASNSATQTSLFDLGTGQVLNSVSGIARTETEVGRSAGS